MAEIAVEATQTPAQLPHVRVAVLGAGKMGGILLQAFLKENLFAAEQIHATVGHAERALALSTQWGVDVSTNNLEAVAAGGPDSGGREAVPGSGPDCGDQARADAEARRWFRLRRR